MNYLEESGKYTENYFSNKVIAASKKIINNNKDLAILKKIKYIKFGNDQIDPRVNYEYFIISTFKTDKQILRGKYVKLMNDALKNDGIRIHISHMEANNDDFQCGFFKIDKKLLKKEILI